ncbi:MAG TPA: GtrA family protein [Solirubrobacteraceae bacterium]|nr:GtrA family protein [Solirubrobacteraceae bacterium]
MNEELAASVEAPPRLRARMHAGMRRPANWFELVRFGVVGASGYVVNLVVFSLLVHAAGAHYRLAATGAFLVAVANNFLWNRRWTFRAHDGHAGFQAARFLTVSVGAFAFNLAMLELLIAGFGAPEVPAQAVAIAAATPLSFLGNKLWSFAR